MTDQNSDWIKKMVADLMPKKRLVDAIKPSLELGEIGSQFSKSMDWMSEGFKHKFAYYAGTTENPLPDEALPYLAQDPSVYLILGSRGSGKTGLGFRMLDLYEPHVSEKYVVGLPGAAKRLLPKWIKTVDSIFALPEKSTALIDEAHLRLGPHIAEADRKELASMLALSRQRRQNLIFISQQARIVSREIVAAADVLIVKNVREHQVKFDRPEFTEASDEASSRLSALIGDRRPFSFVYAP